MHLQCLPGVSCLALLTFAIPAFAARPKPCVTPDERCRFTIVSFWDDRDEVGELRKYRDMNVQVRGIVRPMHGRAGMVLSHARQFYGGPPKFKPNPKLARGFGGEQEHPPIADPNLRSQGRGRVFMNTRDREAL